METQSLTLNQAPVTGKNSLLTGINLEQDPLLLMHNNLISKNDFSCYTFKI